MVNLTQPSEPVWITKARRYLGLKEVPGKKHNSTILGWWKSLKQAIRDDETPWCGGFVGATLLEGNPNIKLPKNPAGARNYLELGIPLERPAYGAVVVFWRGKKSGWSGHVGYVVGEDKHGNLMVLGGNQGDAVNIKPFSRDRVLGYRWPTNGGPLPVRYALPLLTSDGKVSTNEA